MSACPTSIEIVFATKMANRIVSNQNKITRMSQTFLVRPKILLFAINFYIISYPNKPDFVTKVACHKNTLAPHPEFKELPQLALFSTRIVLIYHNDWAI